MNTTEIINNYYTVIDTFISDFLISKDQKSLFKSDFRGKLFAVEGILRFHIKSPENKLSKNENTALEKILLETKQIEDFLGSYSLLFELEEYASQHLSLELHKKFTTDIVKEQKTKHSQLIAFLKQYQIQAKKHHTQLKKINWPKKEKKFLKKTLNSELKRLDKKVSKDLKKLILTEKYGYEELEEGLHEFRRAIRWISIYIQGYKPFFKLSKLPKNMKQHELNIIKEYKNSPFAILSEGEDLIEIDALQYYKLSYYINFIGKIKNQGEMNYYLAKRGYKIDNAVHIEPLAHEAYKKFVKEQVFNDFIQ
jgi:hypothetical protein